jgi:glycosyltransferase involved in cell wall biosynthesis
MRIAVNARSLTDRDMGPGYYTWHLFQQIAAQHPEHWFIFFTDVPPEMRLSPNTSVEVTGKPVKGLFSFKRWINHNIASALQQQNIDVFVSLDGSACLSAAVPQVTGITGLKFIDKRSGTRRFFLLRYQKKAFHKANAIVTVSPALKDEISKRFFVAPGKIHVIPKAPGDFFQPVAWEQREPVKMTYTEGREYFLFTGGFDPAKKLVAVLKGFSQFKKWQQSDMKLVIVGDTTDDPSGMKEKIARYKFREDLVILNKIEPVQLHLLMAAAYALVYAPGEATYGMPVLEAMQSGTAVVTTTAIQAEVDKNAVLFVDANDDKAMGDQMIKLYKDEGLRSRLIEQGLQQAAELNWKKSAGMLWQLIEKAAAAKARQ